MKAVSLVIALTVLTTVMLVGIFKAPVAVDDKMAGGAITVTAINKA